MDRMLELVLVLQKTASKSSVPPKVEAKKNKVKPHSETLDTFQKIRKQAKVDAKPDNTGTARALDFTKYGYI